MAPAAIRAAIIGCGAISKNHASALTGNDRTRLVALCDVLPQRAEALRDAFAKDAAIFTDWRRMLDAAKPEAVHVCTPHDLHAEMACECLKRGIHVYLEQPAGNSEAELSALLTAEASSTARLTVSFQNRRLPITHRFYELIEENGGAKAARAMVTWKRGLEYYTADDWHGRLSREGGGAMINQAIHTLDLLVSAFPAKPISVQGETALWENAAFSEVEDNAGFIATFEDGGKICFFASNDYGGDAQNFYEVLTKNGTRVACMDGKLFKNGERVEVESTPAALVGKSCWGVGHAIAIREFYEAVASGTEVPVSLSSAARTMRILFALYRSHGEKILLTDK